MLEIKNLKVKVKNTDKVVLDNFNLNINDGQIHVIMGPNGTGKSTLSKAILGHYNYEVVDGDIIYNNDRLNDLDTSDRAKKGIFMCMQDPTVISGVSNSEFLRESINETLGEKQDLYSFIKDIEKNIKDLNLSEDMIHRSVNEGFSGGEKKKNEVLQLKMLKPKFIILDELDSGLDVDSLRTCCSNIVNYINENKDASVLIITHYPRILDYIKPDYVHVLSNGSIVKTGNVELANEIEEKGYSWLNTVER